MLLTTSLCSCTYIMIICFRGQGFGQEYFRLGLSMGFSKLEFLGQITSFGICICIIVFFFFLRAHIFVFAPLSPTSGEVGTIRPSGSRCRRFERDPCSVLRVASLLNSLALGSLKANPRVSATSPGPGFRHPLYPRTHVRFGCKPGFSARRGYTFLSLFLHRAPRYVPAAHTSSPAP